MRNTNFDMLKLFNFGMQLYGLINPSPIGHQSVTNQSPIMTDWCLIDNNKLGDTYLMHLKIQSKYNLTCSKIYYTK